MLHMLREIYSDTAVALIRRTMARGNSDLRDASSLAVLSFSAAMLMNLFALVGAIFDVRDMGRLRLTLLAGLAMYVLHRVNEMLVRKWVLSPDGALRPDLSQRKWTSVVGHLYLGTSVVGLLLSAAYFMTRFG
jgi:hypothetical protein